VPRAFACSNACGFSRPAKVRLRSPHTALSAQDDAFKEMRCEHVKMVTPSADGSPSSGSFLSPPSPQGEGYQTPYFKQNNFLSAWGLGGAHAPARAKRTCGSRRPSVHKLTNPIRKTKRESTSSPNIAISKTSFQGSFRGCRTPFSKGG